MLESPVTFSAPGPAWPLAQDAPIITLNQQTDRAITAAPFYWFPLRTVDGLHGTEVRFEFHDRPGVHGAISGDAFYRGKTVVLSGEVRARTVSYLREAQRALQETFYDLQPHLLKFTLWNEEDVYLVCRVNQKLDMPEEQREGPGSQFVRRWTVSLFADNPRTYKQSDDSLYPTWQ